MKITKARLKQIIREEMDILALKEFNGAEEEGAETEDEPGVGADEEGEAETPGAETEVEPAVEPTSREEKGERALASGGKMGVDEFKGLLMTTLNHEKVMPADRKAALQDLFGPVGLKIHTALLQQK